MKKLLLATALAASVASSAFAAETFYVRVDAGAGFIPSGKFLGAKVKSSNHIIASVGFGAYVSDMFRVELDFAYPFNYNFKIGGYTEKFNAPSLTAKALFDAYDFGAGQVYLGAGVGATRFSAKKDFVGTTTKMNWLGTAGVAFDVTEGVKLDVGYSYNGIVDFSWLNSHNVMAGIRVAL